MATEAEDTGTILQGEELRQAQELNALAWGGMLVIPAGQNRMVNSDVLAKEREAEKAQREANSAQAEIDYQNMIAQDNAERAEIAAREKAEREKI